MSKFAVVLAAAGKSSRFGDPHTKKVYAKIGDKPLWMYSAELFADRKDVGQILIVIAEQDKELFNEKFAASAAMLGVQPVLGGVERADSVRNALVQVNAACELIAVHDAARPCLSHSDVDRVFQAAREHGAALLATPVNATLKRVQGSVVEETVPRDGLWLAQTPQVFETRLLKKAYDGHPNASQATDEASLVEAMGHEVRIVEGDSRNIKVTTKADLRFAEFALKTKPKGNPFPF